MSGELALAVPLDRVTALVVDPLHPLDGATRIELRGTMTTSLDGSAFDPGALFDFAAGGLAVVAVREGEHALVLGPSGEGGAACVAAHAAAPCLVPRLANLAHERLLTAREFGATLSGTVELSKLDSAPWAPNPGTVGKLTNFGLWIFAALFLGGIAWSALRVARRRARTALGRILAAARPVLRDTKGDVTFARAHDAVKALVLRARQVDASRRACAAQLQRIDRGALERRADAYARSSAPGAEAALASLSAERAEIARLDASYAASVAELERIESALRLATLRLGSPANAPAGGALAALPLHADLVGELELRDSALAEADATH